MVDNLLTLNEETLKDRIKTEFFKDKKFLYSGDKIDFMLSYKHTNATLPILWGEAKKGDFDDLDKAFTQLLLTIGKHKFYSHYIPPYLCAFNAFRMEFIAFDNMIINFLYRSDIDFSTTPSNHNSESFKHALYVFKSMFKSNLFDKSQGAVKFVFDFKTQSTECKKFIKNNLSATHLNKIKIDKNNFFAIYQKWLVFVKPTIQVPNWELAKSKGIIDADFYLADLLSDGNKTIIEKLVTILSDTTYRLNKGKNDLGLLDFFEITFKDDQKAHKEFWSIYERPPQVEFQAEILERRDLLVPSDVRERKGAFFTPKIWVEKSQEYLAKILGQDYQDDYIIWDCAGGTGNLLSGFVNKANLYLSTLDNNDVAIVKELATTNRLNLLENHVFQFDFLNDDFFSDKIPKSLQEILKDQEKLKKLIIYINPPYAEATSAKTPSGTGQNKAKVARGNLICEKYKNELGKANNELFAQFFMRIYKELNGVTLASFSTLKYLNSSNFKKFREVFKAEFLGGFMVPADTFDNVKGAFPIGFLVWDTKRTQRDSTTKPLKKLKIIQWYSLERFLKVLENELNAPKVTGKSTSRKPLSTEPKGTLTSYLSTKKTNLNPLKENLRYTTSQEFLSCGLDMTNSFKCICPIKPLMGRDEILQQNPLNQTPTNHYSLEIFDSFGGFLGIKIFKPIVDKIKSINEWIKTYDNKKAQVVMGFMENPTPDFQNNNFLCVLNHQGTRHNNYFALSPQTLLIGAVYFSVRHCIKATWQNDRDQFYAPYNDAWQDDDEFKNNALVFMLFHTQNRITTKESTNHFIPFDEE
ncbi:hypothetical protein [Helicobacter cetorum]|uniref:hypothetical protein n=1 Tax=Helicobacter cetorum TaxID=138563 RepID=UPI001F422BEC|nr:hypothetical protein [Helicobacter cetorum]